MGHSSVQPLRTTVVGSHPFPSWLEFASENLDRFGPLDLDEIRDDAVRIAIGDQIDAGLDVITDGEQMRFDFNLSFYAFLDGIVLEDKPRRRFGPPAHDQRSKHRIVGEITAPRGLGVVAEYERLVRLAPPGPSLKASVPGPYTLSGRLVPGAAYGDRAAVAEALSPIVAAELEDLVAAGCREIIVDEPSMSCYAWREDPEYFVDLFNRTVEPVTGSCRLGTHLCFGNYRGHAVGPRRYAPMFPAFHDLNVDEVHLEMASREFAEIELLGEVAAHHEVAVGIIDVKSYYIESVEDVRERTLRCLNFVPPDRLSLAPDCGLGQTARWAARQKLLHLVEGVHLVRRELGL